MYTGTCIRPLWTATVLPTISGVIVLARAHVLIIVRSSADKAATFLASLKSTNGPFFSERLIITSSSPRGGFLRSCYWYIYDDGCDSQGLVDPMEFEVLYRYHDVHRHHH